MQDCADIEAELRKAIAQSGMRVERVGDALIGRGSTTERRQFYNRPALQRRLMRAQPHTGPVRRLLRIREGVATLDQRAEKLMDQTWMRPAMARALGEAQMGLLRQIIDAFGGEPLDRLRQAFRKIGRRKINIFEPILWIRV